MTRKTDEVQIRTLIERWANAAQAQDLDGVVANHTDDVVMFDVPMPLQSTGIGAYQKTWELFFEHNPGGPGSFEPEELQIVASESVAYCHGLIKIVDSRVRITIGLRKEKGRWLIAHEHHSYPIELE